MKKWAWSATACATGNLMENDLNSKGSRAGRRASCCDDMTDLKTCRMMSALSAVCTETDES